MQDHTTDAQLARLEARMEAHQASMTDFRVEVRQQLEAIIERLDVKINGRLDRHESGISTLRASTAEHGQSIKALNHEVFTRGRQAGQSPPSADAIQIPINAKSLTALVLTVAALVLALLTVAKGG